MPEMPVAGENQTDAGPVGNRDIAAAEIASGIQLHERDAIPSRGDARAEDPCSGLPYHMACRKLEHHETRSIPDHREIPRLRRPVRFADLLCDLTGSAPGERHPR